MNEHAIRNAMDWYENILEALEENNEENELLQGLADGALSVEVRTDWHSVGAEDDKPTEYRVLLSTGGPACQITGDLDEHGEPENARLQWQDWGTPWTDLRDGDLRDGIDEEQLLRFLTCFWFGD